MPSRKSLLATAFVVILAFAAASVYASSAPEPAASGEPAPSADAARKSGIPQPATVTGTAHHFDVKPIARGLNRPTYVGAAPGDDAIWVLEQPGRVIRIEDGRRRTVLDLSRRVLTGGEQGLLGMAFHPDFTSNRRLYLHWSDRSGDTRVAEFQARRDMSIRPRPRRRLLHQNQPEENHNGGQLAFGPDGRLYLGLGDGGGAFDPRQTAQDPDSFLGKVIATPVRGQPRWRIVVSGLRNPWRFSFNAALGELWIADVGQDRYEEINRVPLETDEPPKNAGWSVYEGTHRLDLPGRRRLTGKGDVVWPVAGYSHEDGCSVTGGHVYAGTSLTGMTGRYVYGDFCAGTLWSLRATAKRPVEDVRREAARVPQLTHIGADANGELLFAAASGTLYRAVPAGSTD